MKLCTCNNCGNIYEDMNPQNGAKEYEPITGIEKLVILHNDPEVELGADSYGGYWGCPVCCTDNYLQDDIILGALARIDALIIQKKIGVDCTEDDSAFIKGWLRETVIQPGTKDIQRIEDIQMFFPIEYGEHLDEEIDKLNP